MCTALSWIPLPLFEHLWLQDLSGMLPSIKSSGFPTTNSLKFHLSHVFLECQKSVITIFTGIPFNHTQWNLIWAGKCINVQWSQPSLEQESVVLQSQAADLRSILHSNVSHRPHSFYTACKGYWTIDHSQWESVKYPWAYSGIQDDQVQRPSSKEN